MGEVRDGSMEPSRFVTADGMRWGILLVAFGYAVLRYVVAGETDVSQIPLFVTNKALAAASAVYLLAAGISCVRRASSASRAWGRWALHTAVLHAICSVSLLSADYYPNFFGGTLLSATGEASLLMGVLALYCFATIGRLRVDVQQRRAFTAAVLVGLHVALYGYVGWTEPGSWLGALPPITLITFILAAGAAVAYRVAIRRH